MQQIEKIGILGLGEFGRLVASLVPSHIEVRGCDTAVTQVEGVDMGDVAFAAAVDVLVLAIPLEAYKDVLPRLAPLLLPNTLLVDICSVKLKPEELLATHLPNHANLLCTHPLFGPQRSAIGGLRGRKLIVTRHRGVRAAEVLAYCRQALGLQVEYTTAEAHDRAMAKLHALTFFLARGVRELQVEELSFAPPSFHMIRDLAELDGEHSNELFETIQNGNPFAAPMRKAAIKTLIRVDERLGS